VLRGLLDQQDALVQVDRVGRVDQQVVEDRRALEAWTGRQ